MTRNYPTIVFLLLLALFGAEDLHAQTASIIGNTCAVPGTFMGPYTINGVTGWGPGDKWCINNGTISGGTFNGCVANNGTPNVGVTWATGVSSGTISYYHPASATSPTATLTVTIFSGGGMNGGNPYAPYNTVVTESFNSNAPAVGCGGFAIGYQWESMSGTGPWTTIPGATGLNYSVTQAYTQTTWYRRGAYFTNGPAGTVYTGTYPVFIATPGTVTPVTQTINPTSTPAPLVATSAQFCNGPFNYQWYSSPTGAANTYTSVGTANGGNTTTYSPPQAPPIPTTYYEIACTCTGTGSTVYSTPVTINVTVPLVAGTLTPLLQTINSGTTPESISSTAASGGTGGFTYQWQSSTTGAGGTYSNVTTGSGANTLTYSPGVTSAHTWFRLMSTNINTGTSVFTNVPAEIVISGSTVYGVFPPNNPTGTTDNNMNWVLSSGFDHLGNTISQGKSFYDNLGQLIQTQQKVFYRNNADNSTFPTVLAIQNLQDAYARYAVRTLPAPIDYADFSYRPNFVLAPNGTNYTYKNFDLPNPLNADPVGGQSTRGTLGWYYSTNNIWEPYTPTTAYPYARQSFYSDGTRNMKKQSQEGETLRMGQGHETGSYSVPVRGELKNYLQVLNQVFTPTQVGNIPATLQNNAIMTVNTDANQVQNVSISDREGNVLLTATPGTDANSFSFINTINLAAIPSNYTQQVLTASGTHAQLGGITGGNLLQVYLIDLTGAISLVYSGSASQFPVGSLGDGALLVLSDQPFVALYSASGIANTVSSTPTNGGTLNATAYFSIFQNNTALTGNGNYTIYDMSTETSLGNPTTLNAGFYKIVCNTGAAALSYSNSFTEVTYNFYDQLGQLLGSVSPNGTTSLFTGYATYSNLASIPYASSYTYDAEGRLTGSTTPDQGLVQAVYRLDGNLRFSQNAAQAANGSFSYTDYDPYGRVVESGQCLGGGGVAFSTLSGSTMNGLLSLTGKDGSNDGLSSCTKTDVIMITYDDANTGYTSYGPVANYAQDIQYLGGAISTSRRYSTVTGNAPAAANLVSQNWYSYTEEGKVAWNIQYIPAYGAAGYKTTDFTYDPMGRLTKKIFQGPVPAETFVHYYQYDPANGNLAQVYTALSDVGVTSPQATLQANYVYYLHGGLKRVELAGNLQGIDYTYTLQGALKAINNSNATADPNQDGIASGNSFQKDAFGEVLDYFQGDYTNDRTAATGSGLQSIFGVTAAGITDSYAGNIKAMSWYSQKPVGTGSPAPTAWLFRYDPFYRLTSGTWGTIASWPANAAAAVSTSANFNESVSSYDANGNIMALSRLNSAGAPLDILTNALTANTNRLATSTNNATAQVITTYSFDPAGREVLENTGVSATTRSLLYDAMGKLTQVQINGTQPLAQFVYDERGQRIEKLSFNSSNQLIQSTYYFGDVTYDQPSGSAAYQEYQLEGAGDKLGLYITQGGTYEYQLADHLGNIRAVISKTGATILTAADYYPFGLTAATFGSLTYRYGYQGQNSEADPETGWNSFLLRNYNPRIGRWLQGDPKGKYFSSYNGMNNDPVSNTDPDGGDPNPGANPMGKPVIGLLSGVTGVTPMGDNLPTRRFPDNNTGYNFNAMIGKRQLFTTGPNLREFFPNLNSMIGLAAYSTVIGNFDLRALGTYPYVYTPGTYNGMLLSIPDNKPSWKP